MLITEKQLHKLMYIVTIYVLHRKEVDHETLKQIVNLINEISNQQSEQLIEVK